MKPLFLTDCDDTLFSTARKITKEDLEKSTLASTLDDGTPSGYRTPRMQYLMTLMKTGDIIPVTARSRDVLARCDVPQSPAICSNGGIIVLENGEIDLEWENLINQQVGDRTHFNEMCNAQTSDLGSDFRHWIVEENGIPLYVVVKSNHSDESAIAKLAAKIESDTLPEKWKVHTNANNMAIMPPWISKRLAVRYLIQKVRSVTPDRLIIGVGDSLSDLGFMEECDFSMHPKNSQIAQFISKGHSW